MKKEWIRKTDSENYRPDFTDGMNEERVDGQMDEDRENEC